MTTESRQRLETELARIEHRERHARVILRVLAIVGIGALLMAALVSCAPRLRYERTAGTETYYRTEAERVMNVEFPKLSEPNPESP